VNAFIDHLVVAARTLDEGVAWCESTFGIVPASGGRHALMGTHNRVFSIASPTCPGAYFEIIAIDPDAPPPGRTRWFDLDAPAVQAALERGPQLIHWVLRCHDIAARCERLRAAGIERGELIAAERGTGEGLLRWQISVRADGARLFGGALPTLIRWAGRHPADNLPDTGITLQRIDVAGLPAAAADEAAAGGVRFVDAATPLAATLSTARGSVTLRAPSPEPLGHVQS
jgi:hypothetical protein